MMRQHVRASSWTTCLLAAAGSLVAPEAQAQIVANGGFESGFTGWTRADQLGSNGTFFVQTGTTSPVNGIVVPAPPGGIQAAMSDAQGPGSHVLYQDLTIPTGSFTSGQLQFSLFIGNRATAFSIPTPASLDFSTPALNQQARVDLLRPVADPFTVATADVVANVYQTQIADPLVSGYTTVTIDVTALVNAEAGNTLRLRFAEVDNVNFFQMGVDSVSLTVVPIPEPSSLLACSIGALGLWARRRVSLRPGTGS